MSGFDIFEVTPTESMGEVLADADETRLMQEMLQTAIGWISAFKWCKGVVSTHFGMGAGGIFAVFLFKIGNTAAPSHDLLWVLVGDIPPAYLVTHDGPQNPAEALETYIELMHEWVDAVRKGESTDDLIPVNAAPTPEWAEQLASRLDYLRDHFLD